MENLREIIIVEMRHAGIKDIYGIIRAMMSAFNVEEVTQDVVDAIRLDYLS
jgi:hypothetical protein